MSCWHLTPTGTTLIPNIKSVIQMTYWSILGPVTNSHVIRRAHGVKQSAQLLTSFLQPKFGWRPRAQIDRVISMKNTQVSTFIKINPFFRVVDDNRDKICVGWGKCFWDWNGFAKKGFRFCLVRLKEAVHQLIMV